MRARDRKVIEVLRRIVEILKLTGDQLVTLRAELPETTQAHAVIGCCLQDRLDPLIKDLETLT